MKRKNATTYTLQVKGEISISTVRRLKANESVSTNTLDALCRILDCELDDIIAYLPDETE
jgi:DNA-binding Xre family transcriptional regulator